LRCDAEPCFELIEQIARREGFGALVAEGSKALAAHFHAEELAVHVNNLEVPMHDPRAMTGSALVYVTSPRGACHNQSDYFTIEMGGSMDRLGIPMTDRLEDGGKAAYIARHQDWRSVCNSLVMCLLHREPDTVVDLLSAATGHDWTLEEMMQAGERAWNLKRAYNCRLGLTRATEKLPRLLLEPLPDGGQAGHVPDMDSMLKEYYEARAGTRRPDGPREASWRNWGWIGWSEIRDWILEIDLCHGRDRLPGAQPHPSARRVWTSCARARPPDERPRLLARVRYRACLRRRA
jgi:aldehyde:ferredoxin oxidoreductase